MLKLSEAQLRQLKAAEERVFVTQVRDDLIRAEPRFEEDTRLLDRLLAAYSEAQALGFADSAAIVEFLRTEAFVPAFYRQQPVAAWLRKPGQPAQQRFLDLRAAMRAQLRREAK